MRTSLHAWTAVMGAVLVAFSGCRKEPENLPPVPTGDTAVSTTNGVQSDSTLRDSSATKSDDHWGGTGRQWLTQTCGDGKPGAAKEFAVLPIGFPRLGIASTDSVAKEYTARSGSIPFLVDFLNLSDSFIAPSWFTADFRYPDSIKAAKASSAMANSTFRQSTGDYGDGMWDVRWVLDEDDSPRIWTKPQIDSLRKRLASTGNTAQEENTEPSEYYLVWSPCSAPAKADSAVRALNGRGIKTVRKALNLYEPDL